MSPKKRTLKPKVSVLYAHRNVVKKTLAHLSSLVGDKNVETVLLCSIGKDGKFDLRVFGPARGRDMAFVSARLQGIAQSCWRQMEDGGTDEVEKG